MRFAHARSVPSTIGSFGPDFVHTWPTYGLHLKTRALLANATRLTKTPGSIQGADIDEVRTAEWDEQAIYDEIALIAFYDMSGRMEAAAGLTPDQIPADVLFPEAIPDEREEPLSARPVNETGC